MALPELSAGCLAGVILDLLVSEEYFLQSFRVPRSSRHRREYDVQFLLYRELIRRGYDAWMEDSKVDLIVKDADAVGGYRVQGTEEFHACKRFDRGVSRGLRKARCSAFQRELRRVLFDMGLVRTERR